MPRPQFCEILDTRIEHERGVVINAISNLNEKLRKDPRASIINKVLDMAEHAQRQHAFTVLRLHYNVENLCPRG